MGKKLEIGAKVAVGSLLLSEAAVTAYDTALMTKLPFFTPYEFTVPVIGIGAAYIGCKILNGAVKDSKVPPTKTTEYVRT